MDIFFEQAQKEIDLLYLEAVDELKRQEDLACISFMESGDVKKKSSDGIFTKIKKMIETAIEKIKAFFAKKETNDKAKKLQEAVKKDPSLKNKKVKVKDYEKVIKLGKQTEQKMKAAKTPKEKKALLEKYKKQRNAILGGAAVTISVAAILGFLLHGKNKKIGEIGDLNRPVDNEIKLCDEKKDENHVRTNNGVELRKEKELDDGKEMLELMQTRIKDVTDSVNEYGVKATNEVLRDFNQRINGIREQANAERDQKLKEQRKKLDDEFNSKMNSMTSDFQKKSIEDASEALAETLGISVEDAKKQLGF